MRNKELIKNLSLGNIYKQIFGPILENDGGIDAELLSQVSLLGLAKIARHRNENWISTILNNVSSDLQIKDSRLKQELFGCVFNNPLGLAAGFDKNAVAASIWEKFGFGFAEVGTITFHRQQGNLKPRLFRLANERAALNRMGFNNAGAKEVSKILESQKIKLPRERENIIGINLGKSKITNLENASEDYLKSLILLSKFADYIVINISSPNTPNLRDLQSTEKLRPLIRHLKTFLNCPPLLVKIAPDLSNEQIRDLAIVAQEEKLAGIIAINTSLNRLGLEERILSQTGRALKDEEGGLSGLPLQNRGKEVITILRSVVGNDLPLIGVGGIASPKSAWERVSAGASLLQIYTGWIFEGPYLVPEILNGFINQIDHHGFNNISEVVGSNAPWIEDGKKK